MATLTRDSDELAEKVGAFGSESVELVQSELEGLEESLTNNMALKPLSGEEEDVATWNKALEEAHKDGVPPRWHDTEWLLAECYLYRRLYDIIDTSVVLRDYDYFRDEKVQSFEQSAQAAHELAVSVLETVTTADRLTPDQVRTTFLELLQVSLWGNKFDLTLAGGRDVKCDESPLLQLRGLAKYLLVDDEPHVFALLDDLKRKKRHARVDIVMDNAGFELFADLCLADFLSATGLAQRVTLHVKPIPWFVSDTTRADVSRLLDRLRTDEQGTALPALAARWRQHLGSGEWEINASTFWVSPYPFCCMRRVSPHLYWQLAEADLVIVKGDLNYRKMIANKPWPFDTGLCWALEGFHPAPLVTLRVMKADIAAGVPEEKAREAADMDPDWMINGTFATIQFCKEILPLKKPETKSRCKTTADH